MIAPDEALARLLEGVTPLGTERIPLDELVGRTLAEPLVAGHDVPGEARSAMDGIAVTIDRPELGSVFHLIGESRAGDPYPEPVRALEAVRIATGAVVPDGAVRVIPIEELRIDGDAAELTSPVGPQFVRAAGSDFRAGDRLVAGGTLITPAVLALIAAANVDTATVARRPRIAILSSGDELSDPGAAVDKGSTIDSAGHLIAALVREWGAEAVRVGRVHDDRRATRLALDHLAGAHDLVVTIGGASVGSRDHMRNAALDLGATLAFDRIAMQPGKPTWHARLPGRASLLGLPGNPASAFVASYLLLRPLISAWLGQQAPARRLEASLAAPVRAGDRTLYLRGTLSARDGRLVATAAARQDSSLQSVLAGSNCLIIVPAGAALSAGALADVLLTGEIETSL